VTRAVMAMVVFLSLTASAGTPMQNSAQDPRDSSAQSTTDSLPRVAQPPYQHQLTWYEFMLRQFNPTDYDYGKWIEQRRRQFVETQIRNPYFLYGLFISLALLVTAAISTKMWIDRRRTMWITAEMMADVLNQDSYSRKIAQEAIARYNAHIERCNRAIENGDAAKTTSCEVDQLRTELMRVAEERDTATRDRNTAQAELRKKSEILAEMSVRLEALSTKSGMTGGKSNFDVRGTDSKLVSHINNLQEQLYAERSSNRRLKGG
jgi:hypothetical protein